MKQNKIYTFEQLEKSLRTKGAAVFYRVYDVANKQYALMAVFGENFSAEYKSGDAILFYDDNEQTSSNLDTKFKFIDVVSIKPID